MQVWFQGFSVGGKHNKVLWPAAIVTLSLYATDDGYYASRRIELDIDHEYKTFPNNVSDFATFLHHQIPAYHFSSSVSRT
jgi:hypothetical protein